MSLARVLASIARDDSTVAAPELFPNEFETPPVFPRKCATPVDSTSTSSSSTSSQPTSSSKRSSPVPFGPSRASPSPNLSLSATPTVQDVCSNVFTKVTFTTTARVLLERACARSKLVQDNMDIPADDEVQGLWDTLLEHISEPYDANSLSEREMINYADFAKVMQVYPRLNKILSPQVFAAFPKDRFGRVPVRQLHRYAAAKSAQLNNAVFLARFDQNGKGVLAEDDITTILTSSFLPGIERYHNIPPNIRDVVVLHMCIAVAFFLGHQRWGRGVVTLRDLSRSNWLSQLHALSQPKETLHEPINRIVDYWYQPTTIINLFQTYWRLDVDRSGTLSKPEFSRVDGGTLTSFIIDRIFELHVRPPYVAAARDFQAEEAKAAAAKQRRRARRIQAAANRRRQQRKAGSSHGHGYDGDDGSENDSGDVDEVDYDDHVEDLDDFEGDDYDDYDDDDDMHGGGGGGGGGSGVGEMVYRTYLEYAIASGNKAHPQSIRYFFTLFDVLAKGYLTARDLEAIFRYVAEAYERTRGPLSPLIRTTIISEVFDLVRPAEAGKITLNDLIECRNAASFIGLMTDVDGFIQYENRESANQEDDPRLDRYL